MIIQFIQFFKNFDRKQMSLIVSQLEQNKHNFANLTFIESVNKVYNQ